MKNSLFAPNEKNLGGRKQINELVYNHHLSLLKIKPTINTFSKENEKKPPTKIPKKKKIEDPFEYNEVYHSFKKVVAMKKGYINNEKPITMEFKKNLANNSTKQQKFLKSEHENHMISQRVRINRLDKNVEKKKNEFDPIANPPYQIKIVPKKKKEGSLDFMFNPTLNQRKIIKVSNIKLNSK